MQKILSRIKPYTKYVLQGSTLLLLASVFLLSTFNSPIADLWGYYGTAEKHSFFSYLHLTYIAHTARLSQWALIWVGYHIFGISFTQIYPFVAFAALTLILSLILLRSKLAKNVKKAVSFSILASAAFLFTCPSLLDSFLWIDSNVVHFTSIIFSLLIVLEIISITQKMSRKQFIIRFIALLLICFIAQFFSELISIINVAFLGLFCVLQFFIFIRKKDKRAGLLLKVCIPSLLVLIVGLLILYYSPARIARSAYSHSSFSLATIKESIKTYSSFFSHIPLLAYALIVFAAFSFSSCIKSSILNKRGIALSFLVLIATSICSFIVICYAQGFAVPRTLTTTAFGFSFAMIYILAFIIALIAKKVPNFTTVGFLLSFVIAFMFSVIFIPQYIEKIATRHFLASQRDINVKRQIEEGVEVVEISELPILVYGTAEDFYYYTDPESGEELPIWVADQYVDFIKGDYETPKYILKEIDDYSGNYRR